MTKRYSINAVTGKLDLVDEFTLPINKSGLGGWGFQNIEVQSAIQQNDQTQVNLMSQVDLTALGGPIELIRWGDANLNPTLNWNIDVNSLEFNVGVAAGYLLLPSTATTSVPYFSAFGGGYNLLTTAANFTYNGTTLTAPNITASTAFEVTGTSSYLTNRARIYNDATLGTVYSGKAGSTYDFAFANSAGLNLWRNPTGTGNIEVPNGFVSSVGLTSSSFVNIGTSSYLTNQYRLYHDATLGSVIACKSGSSSDFAVANAAGTVIVQTNGSQLRLPVTGSGAGILMGGDAQIFRGAADRLDLASGDSFYIPNDVNGLGIGNTPSTSYTANLRRTTTGALSTSPSVFNAEFVINHGVTGFPSAMRMFVPINAGANNVGYAAGISSQVTVQNGHSAQANNITAADFSARWNTNQAAATSNSLLGARIYTTSDNSTISGTVGNLFGAQLEAGVNSATTTLTVTGSIVAARYLITVPASGAGASSAYGSDYINHSIGASAAISTAGHVRLAPLTATYGSGTKYPVLFNGTNTSHNEIGIWWGTDGNNVSLGRAGNRYLTTNSSFGVSTAGEGLRVAEGANAKQGTAVLVAGVVVVANTSVTANSRIFLTSQVDGGTVGFVRVSARTAGTNFTITSSSVLDTSTIAYQIFEPA